MTTGTEEQQISRSTLVLGLPRLTVNSEILALLASLFFTLFANRELWQTLHSHLSWPLLMTTGLLVAAVHWSLFLLFFNRWSTKPLLTLLLLTTAAAVYFMDQYQIFLDREMMRNLLETDVKEAGELIQLEMLPYLVGLGLIPSVLVWHLRIAVRPWRQTARWRLTCLLAALALTAVSGLISVRHLVPLIREHGELRYLITPANYMVSLFRVVGEETREATHHKQPIALDATRGAASAPLPRAFVLVVGETVRAANWGLNGYSRQTTPELAARDVINFPDVTSCGTDTATSLPCMFSALGKRNYDARAIRGSQSVLHVLDRVGVSVLWRENQSGCKGVCDQLQSESFTKEQHPELCAGGRCYDEVLLSDLRERIDTTPGDVLIVLHMLGNHGPAYYERYPDAFRRWTPTCDHTRLADCSHEAVVNAYDNAVLYTDHILAATIDLLAQIDSHATGMAYISDHGESLGERNLFLHGFPYALAGDEQKKVPLVMWFSQELGDSLALDLDRLQASALTPASHDNLFHTLLGLFDVETALYEPQMDLLRRQEARLPRTALSVRAKNHRAP